MQQAIIANFAVIEGLDGAGTSTQLRLLDQGLTERGISHAVTAEPTDGTVGRLIRGLLAGKIPTRPETMALLFTADRQEHVFAPLDGIRTLAAGRRLVMCDRYLFSSLAYQGVECDFDWVAGLNSHFPLPENLFFIDTPLAVCQKRLAERVSTEIYETMVFQEKVLAGYLRTLDLYRDSGMRIHRLDGTMPPETICAAILASLQI